MELSNHSPDGADGRYTAVRTAVDLVAPLVAERGTWVDASTWRRFAGRGELGTSFFRVEKCVERRIGLTWRTLAKSGGKFKNKMADVGYNVTMTVSYTLRGQFNEWSLSLMDRWCVTLVVTPLCSHSPLPDHLRNFFVEEKTAKKWQNCIKRSVLQQVKLFRFSTISFWKWPTVLMAALKLINIFIMERISLAVLSLNSIIKGFNC